MAFVKSPGELDLREAVADFEADVSINHGAELQTRRVEWKSFPPSTNYVKQLIASHDWDEEHKSIYTNLLSAIQQYIEINFGEPGYESACDA